MLIIILEKIYKKLENLCELPFALIQMPLRTTDIAEETILDPPAVLCQIVRRRDEINYTGSK